MKNKQGKTDKLLVFVIIAIALVGVFYWFSAGGKTILEHKVPADISKEEEGTGLDLTLWDCGDGPFDEEVCRKIVIPDWFATASIVPVGAYSIIRHPPAPDCTGVAQCSGYLENPDIMCWKGKCVLGTTTHLTLGVGVMNPSESEITFLDVAPIVVSPPEFNIALDKTAVATLSPGQTKNWVSSGIAVGIWEGAQKAFTVTVEGTNEYTRAKFSTGDSITLAFDADPTGTFIVSIVSPI